MPAPVEFVAKWQGNTRAEKAAAQEHFIDLCRMLGQPTPNDADPTGEWYAFEKGAGKAEGGEGFADVWMRDHFAWEYKGKRKDLAAAYSQLNGYREALGNPPLLVVCDLARFEIHTNFTNTVPRVYRFTLDDLAADPAEPLRILRAVFTDPESLRPTRLREELTERAAQDFAALATALRARGHHAHAVAHFLDRLLFTMFAEDAAILPKNLIDRLASATKGDAAAFSAALHDLFGKMAKGGGLFGVERIEWFNGGLFDDAEVIALAPSEMETIGRVSKLDWSQIEPAIFGTLFERGLDPDQRTQLGAHYTDRTSILRLVEPVLMAPLRRDWAETQAKITPLVLAGRKVTARTPAEQNPERTFRAFLERLRAIRVLDPACGSGNFLYISLQLLKDLEYEAIQWGSLVLRMPQEFPQVGPQNLLGIEINPFAAELARVTIWIGQIQWMLAHGLGHPRDPVLQPLNNIREQDALLDLADPSHPREAETQAALYEAPFEYVREHVRPERIGNKRAAYAQRWWLHVEGRSGMRKALAGLPRYLATARLTKHRLFVWLPAAVLPDSQIIVIARDDNYTFGVLHSRPHELWALAQGTQLETRPRYTPTTTFETFPFPRPTDAQRDAIAEAGRDLDSLRTGWLNPPGLSDADLAKRTLTNLYNARPTWLAQAHGRLDAAVLAAYGWPPDLDRDELLARLLALNLARSAAAGAGVPQTPRA